MIAVVNLSADAFGLFALLSDAAAALPEADGDQLVAIIATQVAVLSAALLELSEIGLLDDDGRPTFIGATVH
jgi:hypothetical protein